MYHPTTRVLAVLELLQTHGRLSGADLAQRLQVDGRTVRRYIVMLEQIGIPITAERGRDGGYALLPGFKLPPMMFSDDEALALSLGLLAARNLGWAEAAPATASAQAKLQRIMPEGLKQRIGAIDETVRLSLPGVNAVAATSSPPPDNAVLLALSGAARQGRRVHLHYRADGRQTERDFDPYGLAYYSGYWYAVGQCHLRCGMRTFRLDRMTAVQPLQRPFTRPPGFDALLHLRDAVAAMPRKFSATVLIKAELDAARRHLMDTIGLFEQTADGVLLHNQSDDLNWFARQLASLPFELEVVSPPELRTELGNVAARLLQFAALR